jgi:hypothetical protein
MVSGIDKSINGMHYDYIIGDDLTFREERYECRTDPTGRRPLETSLLSTRSREGSDYYWDPLALR